MEDLAMRRCTQSRDVPPREPQAWLRMWLRPMRLDPVIRPSTSHAGGEPGRVIVGGVHDVPGATMLEKRNHLAEHGDRLRRLMLREPRGYPALCANVSCRPPDPRPMPAS